MSLNDNSRFRKTYSFFRSPPVPPPKEVDVYYFLNQWYDNLAGSMMTTSSIAIGGVPFAYASSYGSDVFFAVSGTIGGVSSPKRAVFTGDVIISGSLNVLGGITGSGGGGGGGGGANGWIDGTGKMKTTGSISIDAGSHYANQIGTDIFLYVSGSSGVEFGPNRHVTVFQGDIAFSGSKTTPVAYVSGAHGSITAGGGSTDYKAIIGPYSTAETAFSALWFLGPFTAPTSQNVALVSDGGLLYVNAPSNGSTIFFYSGLTTQYASMTPGAFNLVSLPQILWGTGVAAPSITQTAPVSGNGQSLLIAPQPGAAGANATGRLIVSASVISITGTVGCAQIETVHGRATFGGGGSDFAATLGPLLTLETAAAALYLLPNATAPTANNYALYGDGASLVHNTKQAGGGHYFYATNTTEMAHLSTTVLAMTTTPLIQWANAVASPTITQSPPTTDIVQQNLYLQAQGPWFGATSHKSPGNTVVTVPSSTPGDAFYGGFVVESLTGSTHTAMVRMGNYGGPDLTYAGIWFVDAGAPNSTNFGFLGNSIYTYLNAPANGNLIFSINGSAGSGLTNTYSGAGVGTWTMFAGVGVGSLKVGTNVAGGTFSLMADTSVSVATFGTSSIILSSSLLSVTGSAMFHNGLSGSHTKLENGISFLAAGANITITSASSGQIVIASTSTVPTGDSIWTDGVNKAKATGSISIDGSNQYASTYGTDVFLYVSGSTNVSNGANRHVAVFSGDVIHSGSIFVASGTNFILSQSSPVTDGPVRDFTIQPMSPFLGASTNVLPGKLIFNIPSVVAAGNLIGGIDIQYGGLHIASMGPYGGQVSGAISYSALWFGSAAPGAGNYNFLGSIDGTSTYFNASTNLFFAINGGITAGHWRSTDITFGSTAGAGAISLGWSSFSAPTMAYGMGGAGAVTPTWYVLAPNNDVAPGDLHIKAQGPYFGGVTNRFPGNTVIDIPTATPGANSHYGGFMINSLTGSSTNTPLILMGNYGGPDLTYAGIWFRDSARIPNGSNFGFLGNATTTYLNAPASGGSINLSFDGTSGNGINLTNTVFQLQTSVTTMTWVAGAVTPKITQTVVASGAGTNLTIQAQQGSGSNAGGDLILSGGLGGYSVAVGGAGSVPGKLAMLGAVKYTNRIITGSYYVDAFGADQTLFLSGAALTSYTLVLPNAVQGRRLKLKDIVGALNTSVVSPVNWTLTGSNGTKLIEALTGSYVMNAPFQSLTIEADGSSWWIIGH